jgi:hypothetical protein
MFNNFLLSFQTVTQVPVMTSFFDDDLKEEDFDDEPEYVPPKVTTSSTASVSFLLTLSEGWFCKSKKMQPASLCT